MKVLLDACVLFPTVMREMLLGVAETGAYQPLWSARILEEWARAARKIGPEGETLARGEIALATARFPRAAVSPAPGLEARLWLPDPSDVHVLASAIAGHADLILTLNARDFPRGLLAEEGLARTDPDGFLHGLWQARPAQVTPVADRVLAEAIRLSGRDWTMRDLLRKARLAGLAKALSVPA